MATWNHGKTDVDDSILQVSRQGAFAQNEETILLNREKTSPATDESEALEIVDLGSEGLYMVSVDDVSPDQVLTCSFSFISNNSFAAQASSDAVPVKLRSVAADIVTCFQ